MKRERILIILGVLTALTPFYGLPSAVMTGIVFVYGVAIAYIGYSLIKKDTEKKTETSSV